MRAASLFGATPARARSVGAFAAARGGGPAGARADLGRWLVLASVAALLLLAMLASSLLAAASQGSLTGPAASSGAERRGGGGGPAEAAGGSEASGSGPGPGPGARLVSAQVGACAAGPAVRSTVGERRRVQARPAPRPRLDSTSAAPCSVPRAPRSHPFARAPAPNAPRSGTGRLPPRRPHAAQHDIFSRPEMGLHPGVPWPDAGHKGRAHRRSPTAAVGPRPPEASRRLPHWHADTARLWDGGRAWGGAAAAVHGRRQAAARWARSGGRGRHLRPHHKLPAHARHPAGARRVCRGGRGGWRRARQGPARGPTPAS
jgi:hypothetical protein